MCFIAVCSSYVSDQGAQFWFIFVSFSLIAASLPLQLPFKVFCASLMTLAFSSAFVLWDYYVFYRQSLYFSMGTMTDRTRECLTLFSCWPCKDFAFTTVQRSLKKNEAMHQLQVSCREEDVCFSAASHCCCISRTDFTYKFHPLQSHYRPVNALSMIAPSHSLTSLSLPALELCMNR